MPCLDHPSLITATGHPPTSPEGPVIGKPNVEEHFGRYQRQARAACRRHTPPCEDARFTQLKQPEPSVGPTATTSVLTATTLTYAIGAGITAGAGTRLVLQLLLESLFTTDPFELATKIDSHSYVP